MLLSKGHSIPLPGARLTYRIVSLNIRSDMCPTFADGLQECQTYSFMGYPILTGQLAKTVGLSLAQQLWYNIGRNRGSVG